MSRWDLEVEILDAGGDLLGTVRYVRGAVRASPPSLAALAESFQRAGASPRESVGMLDGWTNGYASGRLVTEQARKMRAVRKRAGLVA